MHCKNNRGIKGSSLVVHRKLIRTGIFCHLKKVLWSVSLCLVARSPHFFGRWRPSSPLLHFKIFFSCSSWNIEKFVVNCFYEKAYKIMPIFSKANGILKLILQCSYKTVPKAASTHGNEFLKAAAVNNCWKFLLKICSGFWKPLSIVLGAFGNYFLAVLVPKSH
jgi:hypothetical protein